MMASENRAIPNINITPLIDVLLVLLIIFMIISPARPNKFDARISEKAKIKEPRIDDQALIVTVHRDGRYQLNRESANTLEDLEGLLHYALDGRPADSKTVFIKAPQTMSYSGVVKVIDVMKAAGSAPIGLQIDDLDR